MDWAWSRLSWPTIEQLMGQVDLYHVAGIHPPPTRRAKVLLTIHGIVAEVIPGLLPKEKVLALREVLRGAMKRADYYLAVSKTTKEDMVKHLEIAPEQIYVVPHGVDSTFHPPVDKYEMAKRLKGRFRVHDPYILYVGAIGHHKNVMGLLRAYRRLLTQGIGHFHLWLVGPPDSAWEDVHQFIARHKLETYVHLPGQVSQDEDLVDLYGGAACSVFPSFYEGWCSPPIEAMACGTPVIVSNRSSLPETVNGAGYLIDLDCENNMAEGMAKVLMDPHLREELITKGLARARTLSWKNAAAGVQKIYRKIEETL
jgi:glycosyltransferase involved in cell wall biosynthesis